MWYMVVWSILLMFMSQFFNVTNVIAFYIFASATMLLLPLVTSIYSTTSGNHGASLLRYVNNNSNSNNRSSRSTEPSTLCGMVKWVSAFELSNNDGDGGCSFIAAYRRANGLSPWAWSKGGRLSGAVLHSSHEPDERRPCSDLMDMLWRLVNCRIIIINNFAYSTHQLATSLMTLYGEFLLNSGEARETSFLYQRISILVQLFNAVLLHDSLPTIDSTDWRSSYLLFLFPILVEDHLSVCLCVYMSVSVCLCVYMSVCLSLCLCLSVCLCVYMSLSVRVSYIFCDPVLACITVIPVLLLHRLPILVEDYLCFDRPTSANDSCINHSSFTVSHGQPHNLTTQQRLTLLTGLVSFCICF